MYLELNFILKILDFSNMLLNIINLAFVYGFNEIMVTWDAIN